MTEGQADASSNPALGGESSARPPRSERGDPRRGGRGERGERADRPELGAVEGGDAGAVRSFVDTVPGDAPPADGEREGQRRRRRGGRGGRDRDELRAEGPDALAQVGESGTAAPDLAGGPLAAGDETTPRLAGADELRSDGNGEREGGRRRGRGRDRQRREGRDGEGGERQAETLVPAAVDATLVAAEERVERSADRIETERDSEPVRAETRVQPDTEAAAVPAATAPAAATVAAVAPPVAPATPAERFELPLEDLRALARSAGLEWVNSDAERIQVVQQAMANEPKPVHVPRAARPRVLIDDGPLVLVETRKDLSQLKLPFEQPQAPTA
jgi:ribonuclease E